MRLLILTAICVLFIGSNAVASAASIQKVVLIGGMKSEGAGRHEYPNGVRALEKALASALEEADYNLAVDAYPTGWPADARAFDQAATVVWYFDGIEDHPLVDSKRLRHFETIMDSGVGLVSFHQASTVPQDDQTIRLGRFLGGARYGMFDRTTEVATLKPLVSHAIVRGVEPFTYRDEFYPTIRFNEVEGDTVSLLTGNLHVQYRDGEHLPIGDPKPTTVAWAFERANGGRSFGYTGLHYLAALDEPSLRRLLLNAIFWTAGREVPEHGASVDIQPVSAQQKAPPGERDKGPHGKMLTHAVVATEDDYKIERFPWGYLTWYVSGALGNSDTMTVGQAVINPGKENPPHHHPNCDEVLHVLKGRILQTFGDKAVEMKEGDTVSIPTGMRHQARNIGDEDAVLAISFSSADRQTVGE